MKYIVPDHRTISALTLPIPINPAFGPGFNTGGVATATTSSHVTDNIVRVGLNYKFGSAVVAKY